MYEREGESKILPGSKCAKSLLEEKKNGKMEANMQELEDHLKNHLGDHEKNTPLGSPGY